jgi:hypothetical protein
MYRPTETGAMKSSSHWTINVGVVSRGRSARTSERNVTRANCFAISGSVRQKLFLSSTPSSGCAGDHGSAGAIVLAQPR